MNFTVREDDANTFGAVVMDGDIPVALCRPASFYKNGSDPLTVTKEQALKNARLFSAAPELLSALIAIWPEAKANDVGGQDIVPLHEAVRAAINKATGTEVAAPAVANGALEKTIDSPEFTDALNKFAHESACEEFDEVAYNASRAALVGLVRAAVLAEREAIAQQIESDVGIAALGAAIPIAIAATIRARN